MTADIEKLKALALAATPGPWRASHNDVFAGPRYRICQNVTAGGSSKGMADEREWQLSNAAYIAAASPAAVLELIADNERLKIENANLQHAFTVATAPDSSHVIPPTRGTGSQQEADSLGDLYGAIMNLPCERAMSHFATQQDMRHYKEGHLDARVAAAELALELACRGRAQGGNTSENSGLLGDSKTAETRMGSSFEGGHLGSAPAAGTDKDARVLHLTHERDLVLRANRDLAKDAERLAFIAEHGAAVRWIGNARSNLAVWDQHFPEGDAGRLANLRASVDFATGPHAKAGKDPA